MRQETASIEAESKTLARRVKTNRGRRPFASFPAWLMGPALPPGRPEPSHDLEEILTTSAELFAFPRITEGIIATSRKTVDR